MSFVTGTWKHRFAAALVAMFVVTAVGASGCSTFREKPGHSPYSSGSSTRNRAKKSSMNPFSIFKSDEPKLADSPKDFVGLPRPGW